MNNPAEVDALIGGINHILRSSTVQKLREQLTQMERQAGCDDNVKIAGDHIKDAINTLTLARDVLEGILDGHV